LGKLADVNKEHFVKAPTSMVVHFGKFADINEEQ
jgi:hypothetical protein